ncbi:MAG: hypothetical protein AAF602_29380, partial [Myxococcota bacterium]
RVHLAGLDASGNAVLYNQNGNGRPGEYFDPFDVEGSSPADRRFTDPRFGSAGPGLHAFNRERLGWLPLERVRTLARVPGVAIEVPLAALDRPEVTGFLSLRLTTEAGREWLVELREPRVWDAGFERMAVYVRELTAPPWKPSENDRNRWVTTLRTAGTPRGDGQLYEGESLTLEGGVVVRVRDLASGDGQALVVVE